MYVKSYPQGKDINFLASSKFTSFTYKISDSGIAPDALGRKIVPAGTVYPANDATALGLLYTDVDVTEGPQAGPVLVEAWVLESRLPAAPVAAAKTAMKGIKFKTIA